MSSSSISGFAKPMPDLPRRTWPEIRSLVASKYAPSLDDRPGLPELYAVLGNAPPMLSAWLDFAWDLRYEPRSPRALRELVILLAGLRLEAPYCITAHLRMAAEAGVCAEQVEDLPRWASSSAYDATERACLRLADAMLTRAVTGSEIDDVRRLLDDEQAIEIVLTVAFYMMVAPVTTTLRLTPGK